jgi:UTP:GlnB (protein PII) uridylyltransferase
MVLLVNEAQVEARFDLFGDSASLDARLVHGLRRAYHRLENQFGHTDGTPR